MTVERTDERDQNLGILAHGEGAGCACKIDWHAMETIRELGIFQATLGHQTQLFDAAVMRTAGSRKIASTVDFIGPVSRAPFDYGYVAVAHALSDLFSVGAKPSHALIIAAWPKGLPDALSQALDGMHAALKEAGVSVLGGHTAYSEQPLLGVSAFGEVVTKAKRRIKKGDAIYLSKPLGSGIAIGALREGACPEELEAASLSVMRTMNDLGSELAQQRRIKLVSDVTGYGLAGQAVLLARQTNLSVVLNGADFPALPRVRDLLRSGTGAASAERNWGLLKADVVGGERVDQFLAADPQTNGPLLVVAGRKASRYLEERGLFRVGHLEARQSAAVVIR